MRGEWKKVERAAFSLLASALASRGIAPLYCPDIVDSPDALFVIEGRLVAIECRYIAHPKLLEFIGRRDLESNVPYEVVVPREPHLWVRDAIDDKNQNIDRYIANTGASEAWLLLHSSKFHSMLTGNEKDEVFKTLLTLGTYLVAHKFTRIWFAELGGHIADAIEIYGPDIPEPSFNWDEYVKTLSPRYPHDTYWYSPAVIQEGSDGEKQININLNDPRGRVIGLQPLDPKYKLDYSKLSDSDRNSNLTGLHVSCYDSKMEY